MDFDLDLKLAVYRHFAATGAQPAAGVLGESLGASRDEIRDGLARLRAQRVMVLEADGLSIRMAPPFSGVETQHVVISGGTRYYANCAWDAVGIPAALHRPATVHSRCEASLEPLKLEISEAGPPASDWLFHCQVPAARWWEDIAFT